MKSILIQNMPRAQDCEIGDVFYIEDWGKWSKNPKHRHMRLIKKTKDRSEWEWFEFKQQKKLL